MREKTTEIGAPVVCRFFSATGAKAGATPEQTRPLLRFPLKSRILRDFQNRQFAPKPTRSGGPLGPRIVVVLPRSGAVSFLGGSHAPILQVGGAKIEISESNGASAALPRKAAANSVLGCSHGVPGRSIGARRCGKSGRAGESTSSSFIPSKPFRRAAYSNPAIKP
jgi:hypothetical protein